MIIWPSKTLTEEWGWDPEKRVWTDDQSVSCTNNQFQGKDKSMCFASIKRGKHHGWTTAASDYYYYIISGTGKVEIEGEDSPIIVKQGDSFCINEGTSYNYWADEGDDLCFVLFMSKLWEE